MVVPPAIVRPMRMGWMRAYQPTNWPVHRETTALVPICTKMFFCTITGYFDGERLSAVVEMCQFMQFYGHWMPSANSKQQPLTVTDVMPFGSGCAKRQDCCSIWNWYWIIPNIHPYQLLGKKSEGVEWRWERKEVYQFSFCAILKEEGLVQL